MKCHLIADPWRKVTNCRRASEEGTMGTCRSAIVCAAVASSLLAGGAAEAAIEIATLTARTAEGCAIDYQDMINVPGRDRWKIVEEFRWTGRCENGKATGFGEFVRDTESTLDSFKVKVETRIRGNAYDGRILGFSKQMVSSETQPVVIRWIFEDGQGYVLGFDGLGLEGYDELLSNRRQLLPLPVQGIPAAKPGGFAGIRVHSMSSGEKIFFLWGQTCLIHKDQFPECLGPDGNARFDVYFFEQRGRLDVFDPMTKPKPRFCPNPREIQSCEPMLAPLMAPLLREANERIAAFFDRLEAGPVEMRRALQSSIGTLGGSRP